VAIAAGRTRESVGLFRAADELLELVSASVALVFVDGHDVYLN